MTQTQAINQGIRRRSIGRFIALLYGLASYVVFLITFLYAIGFVSGLAVQKTVDTGAAVPMAEAFIVNLVLMSVFAIQHSVMARKQFKQWWTQFAPKSVERSTYVLLSSPAEQLGAFFLARQMRAMSALPLRCVLLFCHGAEKSAQAFSV